LEDPRPETPAAPPVLELRGLSKRFGAVRANHGVSLSLGPGEILALLGENGAGKTTLVNLLFGIHAPDDGTILRGGRPVRVTSPRDAMALGIGMVHQHFMLIPRLSVAENILLGRETRRGVRLDLGAAHHRIRELAGELGLEVDPDVPVGGLPVGRRQKVEIVKALYREAEVLILDEPTAVLTPGEVEELFDVMRRLRAQGRSLIFITHKLGEAQRIADRVVVLRGGRVVGEVRPGEVDERELAALMVGREVELAVEKAPARPGETVLAVESLRVEDDRGLPAVRGVSFAVRAGEIVGIAGVQGNGQTELVEALCGIRVPGAGCIVTPRGRFARLTPRLALELGLGRIPEDRRRHGLVLGHSICENLALDDYRAPSFSRWGVSRLAALREWAARLVKAFDIRATGVEALVETLSGGNQQKVVLARECGRAHRVLVAAQPTRGLDVGSLAYIHRTLVEERDRGTGILLVSTELDEVLALADRVLVMYRGEITAELDAAEATREQVGWLMAGGGREAA